jgi:hypothetical protein
MQRAIRILNDMVSAGVVDTYAIAGAMGAMFYVEPVFTVDLDVLVVLPTAGLLVSLEPIYHYLKGRGYRPEGEHVRIEGVLVQFVPVHDALTQESLDEAIDKTSGAVGTRVVGPEHLIAMALDLGRAKDYARVEQLLAQAGVGMSRLGKVLKRHGLMAKWNRYRTMFPTSLPR